MDRWHRRCASTTGNAFAPHDHGAIVERGNRDLIACCDVGHVGQRRARGSCIHLLRPIAGRLRRLQCEVRRSAPCPDVAVRIERQSVGPASGDLGDACQRPSGRPYLERSRGQRVVVRGLAVGVLAPGLDGAIGLERHAARAEVGHHRRRAERRGRRGVDDSQRSCRRRCRTGRIGHDHAEGGAVVSVGGGGRRVRGARRACDVSGAPLPRVGETLPFRRDAERGRGPRRDGDARGCCVICVSFCLLPLPSKQPVRPSASSVANSHENAFLSTLIISRDVLVRSARCPSLTP